MTGGRQRRTLINEPSVRPPARLQRDAVLDEQPDLDVHLVQVVLQLLVAPDLRDDLLAQLRQL